MEIEYNHFMSCYQNGTQLACRHHVWLDDAFSMKHIVEKLPKKDMILESSPCILYYRPVPHWTSCDNPMLDMLGSV